MMGSEKKVEKHPSGIGAGGRSTRGVKPGQTVPLEAGQHVRPRRTPRIPACPASLPAELTALPSSVPTARLRAQLLKDNKNYPLAPQIFLRQPIWG